MQFYFCHSHVDPYDTGDQEGVIDWYVYASPYASPEFDQLLWKGGVPLGTDIGDTYIYIINIYI